MMNNIFRKVSLFTVVLSSCLMMQELSGGGTAKGLCNRQSGAGV